MPLAYLPCGDLCDFVGCPLNGIWTFNVIDQWAADNGTLYEWGIDFNPEIVPGVTTFTPVIENWVRTLRTGTLWVTMTTS